MHERNKGALLLQGKQGALLRGALLLIIAGEWENIVVFKGTAMSKARLNEERHCKRSKMKLQQEWCFERNVVDVSLLQHVFFSFLMQLHKPFFFLHACKRRQQ